MGLLSIIRKQKVKDRELRVLVLGLDNAGKTTIVKQVLGEDTQEISPTMGFEINSLQINGSTLNIWDIGGQTSLRTFWGNYFDDTNVVIWVIDALAIERLNESYKELREKIILQDRLVNGVTLIILVNKMDQVSRDEHHRMKLRVIEVLNLEREVPLNQWEVFLVSGKTGDGVKEAIDWCIGQTTEWYENNSYEPITNASE